MNSRSQRSRIVSKTGDVSAIELQMARKHFACGALLIQRLLGFVEQADVLDRDRGLIAKGLQQRDFALAERAHFLAPQHDGSEGHWPSRYSGVDEQRAVAEAARDLRADRIFGLPAQCTS